MKVRTLIDLLSEYDGDLEVITECKGKTINDVHHYYFYYDWEKQEEVEIVVLE